VPAARLAGEWRQRVREFIVSSCPVHRSSGPEFVRIKSAPAKRGRLAVAAPEGSLTM